MLAVYNRDDIINDIIDQASASGWKKLQCPLLWPRRKPNCLSGIVLCLNQSVMEGSRLADSLLSLPITVIILPWISHWALFVARSQLGRFPGPERVLS